jgi:predicted GH43/DUF377 family glycosyl hydrolase
MNFNWKKKGLLFSPNGNKVWMKEYAQVPVPVIIGNIYRIFFTTRHYPNADKMPISNIAYIDIDRKEPRKVLTISNEPVLPLGVFGTFDEFGLMPADIIKYDEKTHLMYYTGWTRSGSVPYVTNIGLAVSTDNCKTFKKYYTGPIIGLNKYDPILINGPSIIIDKGVYHMFYSSATRWVEHKGKKEVYYFIKYATSLNGIDWDINNKFLLPVLDDNEVQNAPRVSKVGDCFYMWFCYRKGLNFRNDSDSGYKLGLAISKDLKTWIRQDEKTMGITKSESGWDSEMMCYPYMIQDENVLKLFYNGNYFGKEGFGYAEMEIN